MQKPNIFDFATSELSQDAAIAWFLSWAKSELQSLDDELYQCSHKLLARFFSLHGKTLPEIIEKIEVRTQSSHIDVLCVINGSYAVIIEDKTDAPEHGNQLDNYFKAVAKQGFDPERILPIYFKTHEQSDFASVLKHGYKVFSRKDLLKILNGCKSSNDIFTDFRWKLIELDSHFESAKTLALQAWNRFSWMGFYQELQRELGITWKCWDYVRSYAVES